ncbi:putative molybdenum carrier protein [Maridesulfovibrio ferrireducens]|uniref:putative molybdenum carrier protein n=1 Tax=Maridesulfovibrio ferrireducens TaxID=246191 RepID=UPI001A23F5C9|nr:putative molybdenum carrier protein [Maridesulfovibrio ferrireducens]MBI9110903.1 putative molybdenum carrier protein [Maridesulfovibrio ferrireducens]
MKRPATYGTKKYISCGNCSWTGPIESFELIPALISSFNQVSCPNCGSLLKAEGNTFQTDILKLPAEFRIISGGQTGVDRGALDAAIHLGIPHNGWCPKGRKAEDGIIPEKYNLSEMDVSYYWKRTEQNVLDSDGTLVFPGKCKSKGTALTIKLARKHSRPIAVIPLDSPLAIETIRAWISSMQISVLNVAGPRESGCPGIYSTAKTFLIEALH